MAQSRAFRSIVNSYGFKQRLRDEEPKKEKKQKKAWPEFRPPKETIEVGSFYRLKDFHGQTLLVQVLGVEEFANRFYGFYSFNETEVRCLILEAEEDGASTSYQDFMQGLTYYARRTFKVGQEINLTKKRFKKDGEFMHPERLSNNQCLAFLLKNEKEEENDSRYHFQF